MSAFGIQCPGISARLERRSGSALWGRIFLFAKSFVPRVGRVVHCGRRLAICTLLSGEICPEKRGFLLIGLTGEMAGWDMASPIGQAGLSISAPSIVFPLSDCFC
ncbi:hypothetical protein BS50DRAFT_410503 [Corynespora cassiicola Philippines]|uniref:Uncharacterized protein n=1 Tax=Corynespora cassiicola Philippines TaxID=1448308 RepID=A0A2T2NLL6_CORCC|nr:hypothetical protein BS50DRAFT_410503 [Corynespora cassiicola Philippines]